MTKTQIIEEEFTQLQFSFRKITFQDGTLYFCSSETGQSFDLFLGIDERMRLWRFVAEYPTEKAGSRIEFREPQYPNTSFALEINEDGELYYRAEQVVGSISTDSAERILKLIETFLKMNDEVESVARWLIDT